MSVGVVIRFPRSPKAPLKGRYGETGCPKAAARFREATLRRIRTIIARALAILDSLEQVAPRGRRRREPA